jgi:nitrite reductase (NADH) small subunit/3-phenylpropionate/trans-cinnamate dioxygenase ferredoxin subunit
MESKNMSEYHVVGRVADWPAGGSKVVPVGGKLVAVFHVDGQFLAIDDVCPHMGASLGAGEVEGGVVTCPWHGWRFRLADGAWADSPRVRTGWYPVRVVGDEVQVLVNETPHPGGAAARRESGTDGGSV